MTLHFEQTEADAINAENAKLSKEDRRIAVGEDLAEWPSGELAGMIADEMSDEDIDDWLEAED